MPNHQLSHCRWVHLDRILKKRSYDAQPGSMLRRQVLKSAHASFIPFIENAKNKEVTVIAPGVWLL